MLKICRRRAGCVGSTRASGRISIIVAAVVLVLTPEGARADDFVVNSTVDADDANPGDGICASAAGECTLRAAVMESGDTIYLPAGAFVISTDLYVFDSTSLVGAGAALTSINGQGTSYIAISSGDLRLTDLTVRRSGIASGSRVEIVRSTFVQNTIGVLGSSGDVVIVDSLFKNNSAAIYGVSADIYIGSTTIVSNGVGVLGHDAGASLFIEDTDVHSNGTGIDLEVFEFLLERSSIRNNEDSGVRLDAEYTGPITIRDSAIVENGRGLTVYSQGGSVSPVLISNSTISMNRGIGFETQIVWGFCPSIVFENATIANNFGELSGGGVIVHAEPIEVEPGQCQPLDNTQFTNTILAGNASGSEAANCAVYGVTSELHSAGGNLLADGSNCMFAADATDLIGSAEFPIDPMLGPLADNGGPTWTQALLPGSPALEAGSCLLVSDQRGVARPFDADGDGDARCDIGAYEAADFDGDGVGDLVDNCLSTVNADQADADGDLVGDACDNCSGVPDVGQQDYDNDLVGDVCDNCVGRANPRVSAGWLASNPWAVLTGGQRDDDHDGYGNTCDADFNNSFTTTAADTAQYKASIGRDRTTATCGTPAGFGTLPCAIFDLDEGNATGITAADTARYKLLIGSPPGPNCPTCPLTCEAGALRSCEP